MPLALGVPGIGPLLIVLAVVIIVFGPKRIPALARQLGRGLTEFRKSVGGDDDDDDLLTEGDEDRRARERARAAERDRVADPAPQPPRSGEGDPPRSPRA